MKNAIPYATMVLLGLCMIAAGCDSSKLAGSETEINAAPGPLAGTSHNGATPVEYEIIDLGTLGGNRSSGVGINEAGQIAGWSVTASGLRRAFV